MSLKTSSVILTAFFTNIFTSITTLILLVGWLLGFVIAKGFWTTAFCFIPFYAWYLVVEKVAMMTHFVQATCT